MTTSTARVGAIFKEQVRSGPPLRRPTALRTKTTGNNLQIGGEHGEGRGKARTIHGPTQSHSRRRERKDREEHDTKNKVDRRAGLHLSQPKEEARRAPKITKLLSQKDTSLGNRKPEACRTSNAHQHDPGPRPSSRAESPGDGDSWPSPVHSENAPPGLKERRQTPGRQARASTRRGPTQRPSRTYGPGHGPSMPNRRLWA